MDVATEKGLGWFPGPVDDRDWELAPRVRRLRQPRTKGSMWYVNPMRLDQGEEGACVGFGHTQGYNAAPKQHKCTNDVGFMVYRNATLHDEWPNEDYTNSSGTSVRAGAAEMVRQGFIEGYAFTYDVEEVAMWLLNKHPVVIGVDWYEGMDNPTKSNNFFIEPTGRKRGGHCALLDGVRWNENERDYFRGLNSWGSDWGHDGRFRLTVASFEKLLTAKWAVACTWVEAGQI